MSPAGADAALTGTASLGPSVLLDGRGSSRAVQLNTLYQTSTVGAAEFTRIIDPVVDCPCPQIGRAHV